LAIEDIFSSKGRTKILKVLARIEDLNVSEIARRSGLSYSTTFKHLQFLEREGLICHKTFGRIRIFRFNENDHRAVVTKRLIRIWETDK
jgi:predicted transcriptional regulator